MILVSDFNGNSFEIIIADFQLVYHNIYGYTGSVKKKGLGTFSVKKTESYYV